MNMNRRNFFKSIATVGALVGMLNGHAYIQLNNNINWEVIHFTIS